MSATSQGRKARVAALISGRGSNLAALLKASQEPGYPAEIVGVASDVERAAGLEHASAYGVPTATVARKAFDSKAGFEAALNETLAGWAPDWICLAGFMRLVSAEFLNRWPDRVINIHPSLLPSFRGLDTHARALAAGVKIAGCTVHIVRPEMDAGPIVAQAAVAVLTEDTPDSLAERVLAAEHRLYPRALALLADGTARVTGDRVATDMPGNHDRTILFSPTLPQTASGR